MYHPKVCLLGWITARMGISVGLSVPGPFLRSVFEANYPWKVKGDHQRCWDWLCINLRLSISVKLPSWSFVGIWKMTCLSLTSICLNHCPWKAFSSLRCHQFCRRRDLILSRSVLCCFGPSWWRHRDIMCFCWDSPPQMAVTLFWSLLFPWLRSGQPKMEKKKEKKKKKNISWKTSPILWGHFLMVGQYFPQIYSFPSEIDTPDHAGWMKGIINEIRWKSKVISHFSQEKLLCWFRLLSNPGMELLPAV